MSRTEKPFHSQAPVWAPDSVSCMATLKLRLRPKSGGNGFCQEVACSPQDSLFFCSLLSSESLGWLLQGSSFTGVQPGPPLSFFPFRENWVYKAPFIWQVAVSVTAAERTPSYSCMEGRGRVRKWSEGGRTLSISPQASSMCPCSC